MPRKKSKLNINKINIVPKVGAAIEILKEPTGAIDETVEKLPDKVAIVEVKKGVDLTRDGKPPIAVVFECEEERAIQTEWENMDGTLGNFTFSVFPLMKDVVGRDLKKIEGKGRSFSNAYCVPAKRITKCNAKHIYVLY